MSNLPVPRYSLWQAVSASLALASRTLEEVRALSRQPGPQGERGEIGPQGERGSPGDRGEAGPAGALPLAREWSDQVHYRLQVVTHGGALYQAARDTAKSPPHEDWVCLASAGRDGRSFTIRGTFKDDGQYHELDVVSLNGASFAAKRDNPGTCPGDGWQLIATQGKRGDKGERGEKGFKGEKGDPAACVTGLSISDEAVLTLTNGDGSTVELDLYPLLSKLS